MVLARIAWLVCVAVSVGGVWRMVMDKAWMAGCVCE